MVYTVYTLITRNKIFVIEYIKYIINELKNILYNKIPYEIIENIVKNMDINYQWVEIRKRYNLIDSPLSLDFNLENYKNLCKNYLPNLSIAFIYSTNNNIFYYLFGNHLIDENIIYQKIDIFYYLNYDSVNFIDSGIDFDYFNKYAKCINNLKIEEIKKIFADINDEDWGHGYFECDDYGYCYYIVRKNNETCYYEYCEKEYEMFIKEVIENKKWRCYIEKDLKDNKQCLKNLKKNIEQDTEDLEWEAIIPYDYLNNHMNKYLNLYNTSKFEAFFHSYNNQMNPSKHSCYENILSNKKILFKDFIKKIICINKMYICICIIIDKKVCFLHEDNDYNLTFYNLTLYICINLEGNIEINEIKDHEIYNKIILKKLKIINTLELLNNYGNIELK